VSKVDGETEEEDGPVGIVVTDWFNLSLYRMAEWEVNEGKWDLGGRTRLAGSIEAKHEQPHFLVTKEAA